MADPPRGIVYKSGYKYQLAADYVVTIDLRPPAPIDTEYIRLDGDASLWIRRGYAWDGPSGPTIDTRTFMRGSLIHDALYQLIRERHLPRAVRADADRILRDICLQDGMSRLRAWWVYQGVRRFADPAADPANDRQPITAP